MRAAATATLGDPFDDVRLRVDHAADRAARALGARAVTTGRDVLFAAGSYRPDTTPGRKLLVHELIHARQPARPGFHARRDGDELWREYRVEVAEPETFLFAGSASSNEIAATLFSDARLTNNFMFVRVPFSATVEGVRARGVQARPAAALSPGPSSVLHWALGKALDADVARTISLLSEGAIGDADEWALAELCLRWAQRSEIPAATGGHWFDKYLQALADKTLVQPHWYSLTLSETRHSGLEWLLIETEEKAEQVKKSIELRSSAYKGTTGYTVTDGGSPEGVSGGDAPALARGDIAGRFYWSSGSGMQIVVLDWVGSAPVEAAAIPLVQRQIIGTSDSTGLGMGLVVPNAGGGFDAYTLGFPSFDPLVTHPLDDEDGHFYWYQPGARFVSAHHLWEQATQAQFSDDVRTQSGDWRADLIRYEGIAVRIRTQAVAEGLLPDALLKAWLRADRSMIELSGELAESDNLRASPERVAALRNLFDRARSLVAGFDEWHMTDPDGYAEPITTNPYLDPDAHEMLLTRLEAARTRDDWRVVLTDYHRVATSLDDYLAMRLRATGDASTAGQLELAGGVGRSLDRLTLNHPTGQRIKATFYPQDALTAEAGGLAPAEATAVTLLFYAYRDDETWHLVDLTTPRKEKATSEAGGTASSPPESLFTELNTRLRFPRGALYWELPDGSIQVMRTTEPMSFTDWLELIGLSLAAAGLIAASGGAALPATLLFVGSGLVGAAAGVADIVEKSEAGVLTETDVLIDVVSIVGSLASAGAVGSGRVIASSAWRTGSTARFATMLDAKVYLPLVGTSLVADGVTFVVATNEALKEYRRVSENMTGEARDLALRRLAAQLLLSGGMMLMAVKGDIADFRRGRNLYLDVDFGGEQVARPLLAERELLDALRSTPGVANPDELARLLARADVTGDLALRIRADVTQAVSQGLIDPASLQRVVSAMRRGENVDQVRQALAELRSANRVARSGTLAPGSRMHIGWKRSSGPAELADGRRVSIDPVDEADLLFLGRDGKVHLHEVKHRVSALKQKLDAQPQQLENMRTWAAAADDRVVQIRVDSEDGWTTGFGRPDVYRALIAADSSLHIAGRVWSPEKMQQIWDATAAKARELNMWPPRQEFFEKMATFAEAEQLLGIAL